MLRRTESEQRRRVEAQRQQREELDEQRRLKQQRLQREKDEQHQQARQRGTLEHDTANPLTLHLRVRTRHCSAAAILPASATRWPSRSRHRGVAPARAARSA